MPRFTSLFSAAMLSVSLTALALPAQATAPSPEKDEMAASTPAAAAASSETAAAAPTDAAPAGQNQLLSHEELQALVAPIALYSDSLLARVMMASTYPLDVV